MPSPVRPLLGAVRREYATHWAEVAFAVGLLAASLLAATVRYFRILVGSAEIHPDARLTWRPLATAVLDGATLYLPPATDNKPPLFEFINVLVMQTGSYVFVFLVLVALVNGLSAVLLYRFFLRDGRRTTGAVAAAVFVLAVPVVQGHSINVRSFAVLGFFAAVSLSRPAARGAALAAGALCSQYLALAAPLVFYDGIVAGDGSATARLRRFVAGGLAVAAAAYGTVFVGWGWPSVRASLYWSVGVAGEYFTAYGPSVWVGERAWGVYTLGMLSEVWPLLAAALFGAGAVVARLVRGRSDHLERFTLGATLLFGSLLFVRPYTTYWMYAVPWFSALSAVGLCRAVPAVERPT